MLGGIGGYFVYSRHKDRKKDAVQTVPDDEYITDDDDIDADDYLSDLYEEDDVDDSEEESAYPDGIDL